MQYAGSSRASRTPAAPSARTPLRCPFLLGTPSLRRPALSPGRRKPQVRRIEWTTPLLPQGQHSLFSQFTGSSPAPDQVERPSAGPSLSETCCGGWVSGTLSSFGFNPPPLNFIALTVSQDPLGPWTLSAPAVLPTVMTLGTTAPGHGKFQIWRQPPPGQPCPGTAFCGTALSGMPRVASPPSVLSRIVQEAGRC